MKKENIVVGPIRKCTDFLSNDIFRTNLYLGKIYIGSLKTKFNQFNSEIYEEEAILLKTSLGYLNIGSINNDLDLLKNFLLGKIRLIPRLPKKSSQLFVDEGELKSYNKEKIKIKRKFK